MGSTHEQPRAFGSAVDSTRECLCSALYSAFIYTRSETPDLPGIRTSGFRVLAQICNDEAAWLEEETRFTMATKEVHNEYLVKE